MVKNCFKKRTSIKKFIVAALVFLCSHSAASADEILVERIVAIVNGRPVLHTDVQRKLTQGPLVLVSMFPAKNEDTNEKKAVQDAINVELIRGKAEELEIEVDDADLNAQIDSFLNNQGLDREKLNAYLQSQGTAFKDFEKDFRTQMIFRRFQGRVINSMVKITERDVQSYYLQKEGGAKGAVEVDVQQILVSTEGVDDQEILEKRRMLAFEVFNKLKGGMDFNEGVKIYSDFKEDNGSMIGLKPSELSTEIRANIEGLEVGDFGQPVQSPMGFHIFRLAEKRVVDNKNFQRKKKRIEAELRQRELKTATRRWLRSEREKSKIEIID